MSHLNEAGETYWQHFRFAGQFGIVMILVGLCIIVHAIVPQWFTNTGSEAIRAMAKVLDEEDR